MNNLQLNFMARWQRAERKDNQTRQNAHEDYRRKDRTHKIERQNAVHTSLLGLSSQCGRVDEKMRKQKPTLTSFFISNSVDRGNELKRGKKRKKKVRKKEGTRQYRTKKKSKEKK